MKTSDQIIIEELKRIVLMQAQENTLLKARIDVLECELTRYTTRKDSNNSSLPPSRDENRPPRTSSLREKSNRKAGGQPGHEGKTLEMTETPDEIIEHRSCFCPECGKDVSELPFEFSGKRQVIEIPTIKQIVTEHRVYRCTCSCGKIVESDFPVGVDSPVKYGKGIESFIGYLSVRQYLPFKRLQEMLNDIFAVQISEAVLVHDCWKAHFQTPVKKHQLCTAHLERETKYLEDRYKVDWPIRFRSMLKNAHKLKKQLAPPLTCTSVSNSWIKRGTNCFPNLFKISDHCFTQDLMCNLYRIKSIYLAIRNPI